MVHFEYKNQKLTLEKEFDENDFSGFHDAVINASDKHLNQEELIEVWNLLPINIQSEAIEWGMSDTVFKDAVFRWCKSNLEKLNKYKTWED